MTDAFWCFRCERYTTVKPRLGEVRCAGCRVVLHTYTFQRGKWT